MPDFSATDAAVIDFYGEDVTYTPNGGGSVVVKGFFQMPDDEPDTIDLDFIATSPQVLLTAADAPAPAKGDTFTIRGQNYSVKDFEIDEETLVVFHLLEA
jgi:hypothetical protein